MTHKEFALAALDSAQQQLIAAEKCLSDDEHFNALDYIAAVQHALVRASMQIFISKTHKMSYPEHSKE